MQIKDIIEFLNKKCLPKLALEKDPTGLQTGNINTKTKNILISLDCSMKVIQKAIKNQCNLIIVHHPVFWPDKKTALEEDVYQRNKANLLFKHGIVVYSMHTNYDEKYLKKQLLEEIFSAQEAFYNEHSVIYTKLSHELTMLSLMQKIKKKLFLSQINYWSQNLKKPIQSLAIIPGAGNSLLKQVIEKKIDLIITGEIKWSSWILCRDYNQAIITIGHHTEQLFLKKVASWIEKTLPKSSENKIFLHYEEAIDSF